MKKIVIILAACVLATICVAACGDGDGGSQGAANDGELHITFVTPLVAHPVWDVARDGFEDGAKDFGFNSQYVGPQGIDPAEMVNLIEIALAAEVDGIITMPIAPEAMRPAFKKCEEAEVPVVFVGAEDDESTALAFIGTNEAELGRQGAAGLVAIMDGEPIRAHILQSTMDASFAIKARDGYLAALADYPGGFEMVLNEPCNSDMMIAMERYQNAFTAHPDINVAIGVCGEAGPAAAKVVLEMGLLDRITIIAIDDVEETMDFIREGVITGTMAQNFYMMGYLGGDFLTTFIRDGQKPANFSNDSGSIFVTLDNINSYAEALKG